MDVEEPVLELGKLIVDKYEEKYHLDCNLEYRDWEGYKGVGKNKSELKKLMKMLGI